MSEPEIVEPEIDLEEDFQAIFGGVEIVSTDDIQPAAYNPRTVFADRLNLVRLSLAKLGFLLPIYIDADGEILSGHQRHYVAVEMLGATRVPVVRTRKLTPAHARSLNLLFNRATNDLSLLASSEPLAEALLRSNIIEKADEFADVDVNNNDEWMPILKSYPVEIGRVLDANPIWMDMHGIKMAEQVVRLGQTDIMPIVVTPDMKIVNGAARAAVAGKQGRGTILVVEIPHEKADIAHNFLNLLSMRYAVEGNLADDLRANAFRAAPSVRHFMSVNSVNDLTRNKPEYFDHSIPAHQEAWKKHYGTTVLDFGAGNLWDARHMEQMGAKVAAFEPYFQWKRENAREAAEKWFFSRILDDRQFDSIFLSNVMNTVPFDEDRRHVITIVAALCSQETVVNASTRSSAEVSAKGRQRSDKTSLGTSASAIFMGFDTGVRVTSVSHRPAIQKSHGVDEFAALWRDYFYRVEGSGGAGHVFVRCWKPKPIDYDKLADAIRFEFDLPWSDAPRFGMADRALEVIGSRLKVDLTGYGTKNQLVT